MSKPNPAKAARMARLTLLIANAKAQLLLPNGRDKRENLLFSIDHWEAELRKLTKGRKS